MRNDLSDPDSYTHGIPHDWFRHLRATEPVSWQREQLGPGFWAVTRYDDVVKVLRTPAVFSSWRGGVLLADPPAEFLPKLRQGMMNRDPPEHTQLRRLVNKALSPRRVDQLDHVIAEHATALVAGVRERGRCDFATDVAGEMPLFMICELLGVPHADRHALFALTARMLGTEIQDPREAQKDQIAAAEQLRAYALTLREAKLANPIDDICSDLVTSEVEGKRLTESEFQSFFMLLFNAGADTTRSLLSYGLDLLLDHPAELERLRANPDLLPPAIEELVRYVSPAIQMRRTASCNTELAGKSIKEGDKVVVFYPSANRDETKFSDPDRFVVDRSPNEHIGFGYGTHFCLGAPLARSEAKHV
ncbi:MAG TPA: cytochrome P450, partial [Kofleriaceae bacterium]